MTSRPRLVLVTLLLGCIAATAIACSSATSSGSNEPTPTPIPPPPIPEKPVYTVKRGTVIDSLSFTGRVAPSVEKELYFREKGRVKRVYAQRDDMVEEGTLLAELENDDLVRQLAQAEIELETANLNHQNAIADREYALAKSKVSLEIKQIQLAQMEQESNSPEVAIARANLQKAEAAVKMAQKAYDVRAQREDATASPEALALERATIDYEIAQANYQKALESASQEELSLEIQRKQIELAEMEIEYLSKKTDPQLTKAVERSEVAVERLRSQLENTRIVSPIAGRVTSVSAYEGREVDAFRPVLLVANELELEISAQPAINQLERLSEGMSASLLLSLYPGEEFSAKIVQLPYPYGSGGSEDTLEDADKTTHISFDPEDIDLASGDLVKVVVTLEVKEDALWLPPAALRTFAGRNFVVVEDEGHQRRIDVTVGIESDERVEIVEGLEEGQVIIGQ